MSHPCVGSVVLNAAERTPDVTLTGTMTGVHTLAGYADTKGHGRVRFVISTKNSDGTMRFRLLHGIEAEL